MFGIKSSDDDDDIFTPKASSNLANLFGISMQPTEDKENPSLIYTAPKQSTAQKSETSVQQKSSQSSVILAKRVHCYKFENNKYLSRGLYGLAIIQDSNQQNKFIIYKDKQNIISSTQLLDTLTIKIPEGNYCYFIDDMKVNWSILFENEGDLNSFLNELRKSNVNIEQKTSEPKGSGVSDIAASVEVPQTSNNICSPNDHTPATNVVVSNVETANDATKAKILSLMEKMGQTKLLPKLPSTTDLSDSSDTESIQNQKPARKCIKPIVSQRKNEAVKNDVKPTVNNIVPSLVNQSNIQYAVINGQLVPVIQSNQSFLPNSSTGVLCGNNPSFEHQMVISPFALQQQVYQSIPDLNIFLSENRTHNSEVRMNISKLEQKLEKVLEKIEYIKEYPGKFNKPIPKERSMSREQLQLANVDNNEQIVEKISILEHENKILQEKLKHEFSKNEETVQKLQDYEEKIGNLEMKLADLESSSDICTIKKQNNEYSIYIKNLEEEKADLSYKLKEYKDWTDKMQSLKTENQRYITRISKFEEEIQELNAKLQNLSNPSAEISNIQKYKDETSSKIADYERKISDLNVKLIESQSSCSDTSARNIVKFETTIKSVMNSVYQTLNNSFSEFVNYPEIMPIAMQTIKAVTREALSDINTDLIGQNCMVQTDNLENKQSSSLLGSPRKRGIDPEPYIPPTDGI